ncbi:MAG: hypothetical protein KIS92_04140 [Planctomycetota bacterium]|nr:hypothetical protein [Planctomycetota bacterium]
MDGMVLMGLSPVSLKVQQNDAERSVALGQAFLKPSSDPVDSIQIGTAVKEPDEFERILLGQRQDPDAEQQPPSLATMLEAIRAYITEALDRAKDEDEAYFRRMEELTEKLHEIKGSDTVKSAGDMVGALAPDSKDDFLKAIGSLSEKAQEQKGRVESQSIEMSGLQLSVAKGDKRGVEVHFEGVNLELKGHAAGKPDTKTTFEVKKPSPRPEHHAEPKPPPAPEPQHQAPAKS